MINSVNGNDPINRRSNIPSQEGDVFDNSVFDKYVLNSSLKGSAGISKLFNIAINIHLDMLSSDLFGEAKRDAVEDVVINCLREILSQDVDSQNLQTLLVDLIKFLEESQKHNSNNVNQDFIDLLKVMNDYLSEQTFDDPIPKMRSFINISSASPSASVPPFGPSFVGGGFNPSGPSPFQGAQSKASSTSSTSGAGKQSKTSSNSNAGEQARASFSSSTSGAGKSEEFVLNRESAIQTLGLNKQFNKSELNKAYRKKALETHPDKRKEGVSETDANEQFDRVKRSYDYLKTDFDSET